MKKNKLYYIENVETYIPTLNLKSAKIQEHEFESKCLAVETGLTQQFVKIIAEKSNELNDKGILDHGILTVLEVSRAGEFLHEACMSKSNHYNAILKPIFVKEKSISNSIKSPFVEAFSQEKLVERNQSIKKFGIELAPTKLTYPLGHLKNCWI